MSKCNYLNWMHVTHSHVYTVFFQLQRPSWWFCHHHGDSVSLHQTSRTRLFSLRKKITDHLCHWHVWVRKMCRNDRQLGKMAHRLSKLFFWVLPALFPFLFFFPFFLFFFYLAVILHTHVRVISPKPSLDLALPGQKSSLAFWLSRSDL